MKKPRTFVNGSDSDSKDDVSTLLNSGTDQNELQEIESGTTLPTNMQDSCKSEGEDQLFLNLPIYEKYYNLMEVLHIFPMVFKMKPILDLAKCVLCGISKYDANKQCLKYENMKHHAWNLIDF